MGTKRFALIVATNKYDDPALRQLEAPEYDANDLAKVLSNHDIGNYKVQMIINETSHSINEKIEIFFSDRQRDDLLLLYITGHGIKDEAGQLYFAATNTKRKLLRSTAVSAILINEIMRRSRSRRQVLILDTCYSGAFAKGFLVRSGAEIGTGEYFKDGHGQVILTASDAMQYAFEGDQITGSGKRSVFTNNLIEGLQSGAADIDKDGNISIDDLYDYLYDRVSREMSEQQPRKWVFDLQGELVVAMNVKSIAAELPDEIKQALEDSRVWVREGVVRELEQLLRGRHKGLSHAAFEALTRLKEDDSRRVSVIAVDTLAYYGNNTRTKLAENETVISTYKNIKENHSEADTRQADVASFLNNADSKPLPANDLGLTTVDSRKKQIFWQWIFITALVWITKSILWQELMVNIELPWIITDFIYIAVHSALYSTAQWIFLRRFLPVRPTWIWMTIGTALFSRGASELLYKVFIVIGGDSNLLYDIIGDSFFILLYYGMTGFIQSNLLKRINLKYTNWFWANMAGGVLLALLYRVDYKFVNLPWTIISAIGGIMFGIVTGFVLANIIVNPKMTARSRISGASI